MFEQWRRTKNAHPGEVLFFRLGDFYEMFADDALEVSKLLNLTLTHRNGLPMCGVPHHSCRSYIGRLMRAGKKVAICEQLTEPGNGLIRREVTEVITPGTTIDEYFLDNGRSNYIGCLCEGGDALSFSYLDLSTGGFRTASFPFEDSAVRLRQELERLDLKELIVQESLLEENPEIKAAILERRILINRWTDWSFDSEKSLKRLKRQFEVESLKGFGLRDDSPEIISAGALLEYIDGMSRSRLGHIKRISLDSESEFVGLDESSIRNLELLKNMTLEDTKYSLLGVVDDTRTPMGRRLLKYRITHPLRDGAKINARLAGLDLLYHDQVLLSKIRGLFASCPDLERQCSRLAMSRSNAKDLLAVKNALFMYLEMEELLSAGLSGEAGGENAPVFRYESEDARNIDEGTIEKLAALAELLERAILTEPSTVLTEGKLIKSGYNAKLDELHEFRDNGRSVLKEYLEEEKETTGISSLKISYNRLIGYFFEVTNAHLSKVPKYFIKRQGLAGAERYTTERLVHLESEINGAEGKIIELEKKLFLELAGQAAALVRELSAAAARMAEIDTIQSLAQAATVNAWVRPEVSNSGRIKIIEGRHPVIEAILPRGEFIPNDTILDPDSALFALITGPNMAGKSTYLRQSALIVIMAQMGSFVPASSAEIGITDRVYCRVGAQDNLARGESTFLVEMNETAFILNTATKSSLVIMDEVGRGTGTLDGLAIARSVCDELLCKIRCRTLFATHYHELVHIRHPKLVNRSLAVEEENGKIIFRRRLIEQASACSYGLQVARLAGLSEEVLSRAAGYLDALEQGRWEPEGGIPLHPETAPGQPDGEAGFYREAVFEEKPAGTEQRKAPPAADAGKTAEEKANTKDLASSAPGQKTEPRPARKARNEATPSLFDF